MRNFLARLFGTAAPAPAARDEDDRPSALFSTHMQLTAGAARKVLENATDRIGAARPRLQQVGQDGVAMDVDLEGSTTLKSAYQFTVPNLSETLVAWYASQGFIGHQMAAIIAQHWLVDKACTMPARDAVRHGFEIALPGTSGEGEEKEALEKANKKHRLRYNMQEFVRLGRVFGIRIVIFKVESTDPRYYEKPFNPDGVTPGSYKGMIQMDPYWCSPILDQASAASPATMHFYEPTWWMIDGRKYHRSHLCIFRTSEPPDLLKPSYAYGGVPIPQRIMERVYGAERTANEAPQLAMTKRTMVWGTDIAALLQNQEAFAAHMGNFIDLRDNYGVKINDINDKMEQHDTSLADLDDVIMSQYQIVAAAAGVPATKLLGTTPKGFNATGDYEADSYHEELETVQENDLTPLAERHMLMVLRSEVEPQFGHAAGTLDVSVNWRPVDSPTAKERADLNKTKAETDKIHADAGAIDGMDIRDRLRNDPDSGYHGISEVAPMDPDPLGLGTDPLAVDPLAIPPDPLAPAPPVG